jgi:hypothetical protein
MMYTVRSTPKNQLGIIRLLFSVDYGQFCFVCVKYMSPVTRHGIHDLYKITVT